MVSGGLIQLVAYGAPDVYLIGNTDNPYASNHRESIMYWFLDRDNGLADKDDMITVPNMPGILDHVPCSQKPTALEPFRVNTERAWRNAISNHNTCH